MDTFQELKAQIEKSVSEHNKYQAFDGLGYNGITIVVLLATTTATIIPTEWLWFGISRVKVLTGVATFLVALERTLNLGARWRYHREMRHGYLAVLAKINFYQNMPDGYDVETKKRYFQEIYSDLDLLRDHEHGIPGIGQIEPPSPQDQRKERERTAR